MKKEKSVGKNQIFTVISILCGIGSVIGFWLNDLSELIPILLILLCGVFAYLGLRHKSIYIVFAMGIAHCLPNVNHLRGIRSCFSYCDRTSYHEEQKVWEQICQV